MSGKPGVPADSMRKLSARVPGCVHLDLMRAGKIPDPYVGMNEKDVAWVAECDWSYVTHFKIGEPALPGGGGARSQLVAEGLDTIATLLLDDRVIAETGNMFVPQRIDLPDSLEPGEHKLEVRFASPIRAMREFVERSGRVTFDHDRVWLRKAQYSFGWDWGPVLPTSGIWRPIYLQGWSHARIAWFRTGFQPGNSEGLLTVFVEVEAEIEGEYRLEIGLKQGENRQKTEENIEISAKKKVIKCEFMVENPRLWWPNGVGEAALADLTISLRHEGTEVHRIGERIGLRTVEWIEEPDQWGRSFFVRVNGRDIFAKGANWIPSDMFLPRLTTSRYRRELELAAEANMNMLRVWGGGIYEDPAFYRSADELGLMVWQDFPYACALYPDDAEFRENARCEAEAAAARLARHPSIVIWCGNNEIERDSKKFQERCGVPYLGQTIWTELLPEALRRIDPAAFYIFSSPSGGSFSNDPDAGDRHVWEVWSYGEDYPEYLNIQTRFASEFGFQAPASPATMAEVIAPGERHPQSETFKWHNKQIIGPARQARFLEAHHGLTDDFDRFIRLSQDIQGRAMWTAVGHWRSSRPRTMGTLIWQLNDCWQVWSWSLYDWRLRPKAAYYHTKRAYASRALFLFEDEGKVVLHAVNDSSRAWRSDTRLRARNFDGEVIREELLEFEVNPNGVCRVVKVDPAEWLDDPSCSFLVAEVEGAEEDRTPLRAAWFAKRFKHLNLPEPGIRVSSESRGDRPGVLVSTERLALGVWIEDATDPDLFLADNALDLMPGERRWIEAVHSGMKEAGTPGKLQVWTVGVAQV